MILNSELSEIGLVASLGVVADAEPHGFVEQQLAEFVGVDVAQVGGLGADRVPVNAVAVEDAAEHFGFLAAFVPLDNPTSSALTRELLDRRPTRPGLIDDLDEGHYFEHPEA